MLASGATPMAAVDAAGELLARERGSADVAGSRWACAVLGYATGDLSGAEVRQYGTTPAGSQDIQGTRAPPTTPPEDVPGLSTEPLARSAPPQPSSRPHATPPSKTSVAPPPPGPVAPPDYPIAPPRRRGPWLLVIAVVTAVAVVGAVAWLSFGDDLRQAFESTPGASTGNSAGNSAGASTGKNTTCWDGQQATSPDHCTVPHGEAGLRWVFPSFDRDYENCYLRPIKDPSSPRHAVRSWFCPSSPGSTSGTSYTESKRSAYAVSKYDKEYPTPRADLIVAGHNVGYRWRLKSPNSNGLYKVSFTYHWPPSSGGPRSWPFSTSVYALTQKKLDRACAQLIIRAPSTLAKAAPPCS